MVQIIMQKTLFAVHFTVLEIAIKRLGINAINQPALTTRQPSAATLAQMSIIKKQPDRCSSAFALPQVVR